MYEEIKNKLKKINIEIEDNDIEKFCQYMNLLLDWNKKINLTAIKEPKEIIIKHFVDSLTISKYIEENKKIVDIGTGAGFPGIPLAIIRKKNEFTLVDSLNKRIKFLDDVKEKIKLINIQNIHCRAEDFGNNVMYREKFDIAVSRAVANMSTLIEYLLPTVKVGGKIICMKGSKIEEELKNAEGAIKKLGGTIKEKEMLILPETDIKRNLIIIEKINPTPKAYPRRAGQPEKNPLK